ncbi:hypothetical protein F4781DRAFT_431001 [Annulohypoxylon bovei var. microspora]|nr:hypothetical protein F4781DRAFT_431001 [Annulohypoxylon bovei var. microspora]
MSSTKDGKSNEVLYFAYGSNLSPTQMHDRCPSSPPVGLAHLSGWTWLINERGYANIVEDHTPASVSPSVFSPSSTSLASSLASLIPFLSGNDGKKNKDDAEKKVNQENSGNMTGNEARKGVYGVLYRLHPIDEGILDKFEGVPWAYEKRYLNATLVPVSTVTATTDKDDKQASPQNSEKMETVRVLVYIDFRRVLPDSPKEEYIDRMNLGINEAMAHWGLPKAYVDAVMRPFIPKRAID